MSNFNHSIDKMVKEKFLAIYSDALDKADKTFNNEYLPQITDLSFYDQIKFLNERKEEIKNKKDDISISAYFKNSNSEEWLLKLFSSRTSILNVDDSKELRQAVYLGNLRSKITEYLGSLKDKIPPYSYELFNKGISDPILFDLNYSFHVEDSDDFLKIRHWQAQKVLKVVSFETTNIIKGVQNKLKDDPEGLLIIENDVKHYDKCISGNSFHKVEDLIEKLKQFSFMSEYEFDKIDTSSLIDDFNKFIDGDMQWSKITPEYSDHLKKRLKTSNKTFPFSDSPMIFYTIFQTIRWMKTVLKNKSLNDSFKFPDFKALVVKAMEEAEKEAVDSIDDFNDTINITKITAEQAEAKYIDALEGLRHDYNNSEDVVKEYFASLQRGGHTEHIFELNAFFFDLEDHIQYLKTAYILRERIHYFIACCREYGGKNRVEYPNLDDGAGVSEIMYLAHNMVLDNDLHERLSKIMDDFMLYTTVYCMPFDIALQNVREEMHDLFIQCVDRLLNYLEDADPENKVMYIQTRLKQLKHRELSLKNLSNNYNEERKPRYTSLLKEYLEIEAEFIKETKDISFFQQAKPIKQIQVESSNTSKKTIEKTFSFGFKSSEDSLKSFISELNRQIYLLRDDVAAVDDLVTVLTAEDLNSDLPSITFNCETTQLYYIFNKLKPYFNNLSFKNIEKSQLFFTKNGNLLKAQNLSASKVDFPKNYEEIDKAFTLLQ
ncbi:DUF6617 family protein [Brumimicrobium sp.]|uniref:DUF6617 family protein n=1 Tax=Brumimicrobium sp. TaxID=2029867 RepID=UPI003A8D79D1